MYCRKYHFKTPNSNLWGTLGVYLSSFTVSCVTLTNDLPECLQLTKPHMYADDTLLSTAAESTVEVLSWINQDLVNTRNWLLANKLIFNVTKTEHMFFGTSFRLPNLRVTIPVTLSDRQIKRVKQTKYLGVYLDENLKWDQQIDKVCTSVSRSISGLRQA